MSKLSQLFSRATRFGRPKPPDWKREDPQVRRSYALNDLDLKLETYLAGAPGFFIEAGANDGVSQSNTLFFEKHYQWTGLLIEPVPELAKRCQRNRPDCTVVNTALVPFDFPAKTIEMHACNLMSLVKGAMKSDEADLEHIERGCQVQSIEAYDVEVPAIALSDLLDRHSIKQVDFLSLDVEGFELSVLKGIDFARHAPKWMLIEARFRDEIDRFLSDNYEPIDELSHHDILYRRTWD